MAMLPPARLVTACALSVAVFSAALAVDVPVRYRVTFVATWSAATHPDFPGGAHFSPPIGGVHDQRARFWRPGDLASLGIQRVAELGSTSTFRNEILAEANLGHASFATIEGPGIGSPGSLSIDFVTNRRYPQVTLVTMVAPSPDWFVGTRGLDLLYGGAWRDLTFTLISHDAGTDSGVTYASPNQVTVPHVPIFVIDHGPLAPNDVVTPVGTYTFEILDVDGLAPYSDFDVDGLSNLREAAIGSNPRSGDTDGDNVADAVDHCPYVADAAQADADQDGVGDACDVCPLLSDAEQVDSDVDGEGDACDEDDGFLHFTGFDGDTLSWQVETAYATFNLYRGDLDLLRATGEYTQDPSGPVTQRNCGLGMATLIDAFVPQEGAGVFYLVTGVDSQGDESSLGDNGDGVARANAHPCP